MEKVSYSKNVFWNINDWYFCIWSCLRYRFIQKRNRWCYWKRGCWKLDL